MRLRPGEPEASGWRVERLSEVVRRLREPAPAGRPVLVAIDGRGGAGKSSLAERLRAVVAASAVVHTDDVAWNHAYFDWSGLLIENIVKPLHRGEAVEFRPRAWVEHHRPGGIRVAAGTDVVWIEGTGIIREELVPWFDASIWVQGDLDEQERRLVVRDGDSADQRRHVAAWLAEELPLILREQPWRKASFIVAGTTGLPHDPGSEIVIAPAVGRVGNT
ncbi:hypothetical protein [Lentzea sp. NPDC051838]|uniref:uridine kinase family protein n=1 Tax=Lentzea sp. NPDC051838 TaxID=3154849 RepID=UPI00343A54AA